MAKKPRRKRRLPGGWTELQRFDKDEWSSAHALRVDLIASGWEVRFQQLPGGVIAVHTRRPRGDKGKKR